MPFCPKCHDEFQEWVKTCPDCRVRLLAELHVQAEPTPSPGHAWRHTKPAKTRDELVLLASASSETEARMWAGILEDKGIRTMVKTYEGGGFRYPPVTSIIQPSNLQFDVYVLESDVERAGEILGRKSDSADGVARVKPTKERRVATTAAGIVDVANGVVYICLAVGLAITTDLDVVIPIAIAAIGVLAIAGGICTLLRKNWWIAVAGAIVSMVPFFPPFLVSGSRDEFE
jgi:hypothetical protein